MASAKIAYWEDPDTLDKWYVAEVQVNVYNKDTNSIVSYTQSVMTTTEADATHLTEQQQAAIPKYFPEYVIIDAP